MSSASETDAGLSERVEALERELASLTYSVSHDVRAPLRAITGFSEALIEDYADRLDAEGMDYLRRIHDAAARMEQLVNALVELSRVSRAEMSRETVDISEIARSITTQLSSLEPQRDVKFTIESGLTAEGDPGMLRVAFGHLLGNAWKFTSKHPAARIEVGSQEKDGRRAIFVRDDGAGFDPAYAGRLFGAFQRFHHVGEFEGTGIGLAMVQRIVSRHSGRVWAEAAVERGATFYIALG